MTEAQKLIFIGLRHTYINLESYLRGLGLIELRNLENFYKRRISEIQTEISSDIEGELAPEQSWYDERQMYLSYYKLFLPLIKNEIELQIELEFDVVKGVSKKGGSDDR